MPVRSQIQLIQKFYESFRNLDAEGMAGCYHDRILFYDPVFRALRGEDVKDMWRMLIKKSKGELVIRFHDIYADPMEGGGAQWEAIYTFNKTGRRVHNRIRAKFNFEDGKIIAHKDSFSFWHSAFMAFGLPGLLVGFTDFFREQVSKAAIRQLHHYQEKEKAAVQTTAPAKKSEDD